MKEIIRVRCPCCSMMTDLDRMAMADDTPAEVRLYIQKIGGKKPAEQGAEYKKIGRGKAPGVNIYEDITDSSPDQVAKVAEFFKRRAEEFLKS